MTANFVALCGPAQAEVSTASSAYDSAAEAVRTNDLPRAKRAFLLAYIEAPRPIILYNLGLVCRDLGQPEEAASYFQRYLDEPSVASDDPLRAEATRELAKLPPPVNASEPRRELSPPAEPASQTPAQPASAQTATRPSQPTAIENNHEPEREPNQLWNGVSLGMGGVGLVTALASGVLLLSTPKPSTASLSTSDIQDHNKDKSTTDDALSQGFASGAARQNRSDTRTAGFVGLVAGTALLVGATAIWFTLGEDSRVEAGFDHVRLTFLY